MFAVTVLPRPLAGFKELTSQGGEGRRGERKAKKSGGRERGMDGRGGEGTRERKGKERFIPALLFSQFKP